jgi:hypothetical protein
MAQSSLGHRARLVVLVSFIARFVLFKTFVDIFGERTIAA